MMYMSVCVCVCVCVCVRALVINTPLFQRLISVWLSTAAASALVWPDPDAYTGFSCSTILWCRGEKHVGSMQDCLAVLPVCGNLHAVRGSPLEEQYRESDLWRGSRK